MGKILHVGSCGLPQEISKFVPRAPAGGDLEGVVQQAAEDSDSVHPGAEAGAGVSQS